MTDLSTDLAVFASLLIIAGTCFAMAQAFDLPARPSIAGVMFLTVVASYAAMMAPWMWGLVDPAYYLGMGPAPDLPWVLSGSLLFFAIGAIATARLHRFDIRSVQSAFYSSRLSRGRLHVGLLVPLVVGAVALALVMSFVAGESGLSVLFGSAREPEVIRAFRVRAGQSEAPYVYLGSIVLGVVGPFLLLVTWNLTRSAESRLERVLAGAMLVVLTAALFLGAFSTLQRSPLVLLLLFGVSNWFVSRSGSGRMNWKAVAVGLGIPGTVGILAYMATYPINPIEAAWYVFDRLFVVPLISLDSFLHVYPRYVDFSYGLGIGLVARLAGVTDYQAPALLVGYITTGRPAVSFNGFWACDLWANFGYPGVIVGSAFVGALGTYLDRWCLAGRRTTVGTALYGVMLVQAIQAGSVSIFTMLLSGGMILVPAMAFALEARVRLGLRRGQAQTRVGREVDDIRNSTQTADG